MDFDLPNDERVRAATFEWLARIVAVHGDVLPRSILTEGYELDGRRVHVIGPQGIFKPVVMDLPLSITTSPKSPYDDHIGPDNLLRYSYRGTDPDHRDNDGLRTVMANRLPLVYFHGIVRGKYSAFWPVFVVGDLHDQLAFSISIDDAVPSGIHPLDEEPVGQIAEVRREYAVYLARTRLHQDTFRELVLKAYRNQCALCRLRHSELLDAAHIMPDSEPEGEPTVNNGIALCRLHHAAFDKFFLAVRPDRVIEIRRDLLEERDGPTLQHAIQGLHNQPIVVPNRIAEQPSIEFLTKRYERFLDAAKTL